MSIDEPPAILLRWCKDRSGIRLKREYLRSWREARSTPITNNEAAYNELISDFLNKDISITSESVIAKNFGQLEIDTFPPGHLRHGGGVVLQIQDAEDISNSAFSLLNNLNNLTQVRQVYVERSEDDQVDFPRGLLRWTLTDGVKNVQAMELETISELNLKTPFGTKLLIQCCQVKRGMLLLTKKDVKVLGGDVPEFYGGNMITELESRFKAKLGMTTDPTTPPSTGSNAQPERPNRTEPPPSTAQHNEVSDELMQIAAALDNDDFSLEDMSTDDISTMDISNNDIEMDLDVTESRSDHQQQSHQQQKNIPNGTATAADSDDDFVATQLIPRPRLTPVSLSKKSIQSSSSAISLSKKHTPPREPEARHYKRVRQDSGSVGRMDMNSESYITIIDGDEKINLKKEKIEVANWIDPNEMSDGEHEGITVDEHGKTRLTFEKLSETLKLIEAGQSINFNVETVTVRARWIKTLKFKFGRLSGFNVIINVRDADLSEDCCIKERGILCKKCVQIVLYNKTFARLIDRNIGNSSNWDVKMQDERFIKQVVNDVDKKMSNRVVDIELDLTLTEDWTHQGESRILARVTNLYMD